MHPPPPAYHGRANVPGGPKPTPLPMQNKPPLMANNILPTVIQQRGLPLMQPKTILKHPSQYKPTVSQPQIQQQQQQQPQTSQPPSLEAVKQPQTNIIQNSGSAGTLHSTTSQSHINTMSGTHVVSAEKLKPTATAESECLLTIFELEFGSNLRFFFVPESVPKYNAVPPPKLINNNSSTTPTTSSPETSIIEVSATSDQIKQLSIGDSIGSGKDKTPMCLVNELARFNKVRLLGMPSSFDET